MKKLVIVESPAKAKTIAGVLGPSYVVRASLGHVRDLPDRELGVDIAHNFKPAYHLLRRSSKILKALRAALDGAEALYLATDPDREGEAIAWHLQQALKPACRTLRVAFHAITPADIAAAFAQPRAIDMRLVDAQQARRVLDRLVGYQVSPLVRKSTGGKSAGRVQSIALRLVVEREQAIRGFTPVEYWTIQADLARPGDHPKHFLARLYQIGDKRVGLDQAIPLKSQAEAERVLADLAGAAYRVAEVKHERKPRKPWPPFTTSTLQQGASARLRMSPAETMKIAQELYEGVDVGEGKAAGLITYMRTDSTAIAPEAQAAVRAMITETLGAQYLPAAAPQYATRVKNAQEAHEAIRPTDVRRYPNTLKDHLSARQFQLYDLIWRRFVASQMAAALYAVTTLTVTATVEGQPPSRWRAVGRALLFDGFLRVWQENDEAGEGDDAPQVLPKLSAGDALDPLALLPKQHFTQPTARYTESALIKALEELGIGRPSTYAATLKTLQEREYVALEKRALSPTPLGESTCGALLAAFPDVMDYQFTAQVEDWLDDVSRGERGWVQTLQDFYGPFEQALRTAPEKMAGFPKLAAPRGAGGKIRTPARRRGKTPGPAPDPGVVCPKCGAPMVKRRGPRGEFWGCSKFPACKGARNAA